MGDRKELAGKPKPGTKNKGRIEEMPLENKWTQEREALQRVRKDNKEVIKTLKKCIDELRRDLQEKDDLVVSLMSDIEDLKGKNLLLENNARLKLLSGI